MRYFNIRKSFVFLLVTCVIVSVFLFNYMEQNNNFSLSAHCSIVNNYYEKRKNWTTSNIGSILFKNVNVNHFKEQNRSFTIWLHKFWKFHQWRHRNLENFTKHCRVKNCKFIPNPTEEFDAVLVNIWFGRVPTNKKRNPKQIWIFYSDESPLNRIIDGRELTTQISIFANKFNWSFTYRHDADIPIPAGRVVALKKPILPTFNFQMSNSKPASGYAEQMLKILVPNWEKKRKDVLVTTMYSNCIEERDKAIEKLSNQIEIHVYGKCSIDPVLRDRCPQYFTTKCTHPTEYLFYLVMENTKCFEYITEKSFYHGFTNGAIPIIIIGPTITDCQLHFPPNSFIYVRNLDEFNTLGDRIVKIADDMTELLKYHEWRNHFTVTNEHGCFNTESKYMCRICEGLNYNNHAHSEYDLDRINSILDPDVNCWE